MLQHYDEKKITAARDLILSKYEVKKRPSKRQGPNKAKETLKDSFGILQDMDADSDPVPRLVTDSNDFASLEMNHIDVATFHSKLSQLSKDMLELKGEMSSNCENNLTQNTDDLTSIRQELKSMAVIVKGTLAAMSERLSTVMSVTKDTAEQLSDIQEKLKSANHVDDNAEAKKLYTNAVNSFPSLGDSGDRKSTSTAAAEDGQKNADFSSDNTRDAEKLSPDSCDEVNNLEWTKVERKQWAVKIFVSRLKPGTRIGWMKQWFWDTFQTATSVRFLPLKTRYDSYVSFKITVKGVHESELLDCTKWPKSHVLDCYDCALVKKFIHRA